MTRLIVPAFAIFVSGLAMQPAVAQTIGVEPGSERVNTLIVYGDDECPQSTADEITVCARMDENERFRIPENLRLSDSPANESWATRVQSFEAVGDFGPLSCSPVGMGGELGCTAALIETAYAEKASSSSVRFSQLIEQARAERLSTIDAEAADTQARVEELERQYMEKVAREEAAEAAATPDPLPRPR